MIAPFTASLATAAERETHGITFTVRGIPVAEGNLRRNPKGGGMYAQHRPELERWRSAIQAAAADALDGRPIWHEEGIAVRAIFAWPRPIGHYNAAGTKLRPSAPFSKVTKPDVDKVLRALLDALTGVVWRDDSQVVDVRVSKVYGDTPGATVTIEVL